MKKQLLIAIIFFISVVNSFATRNELESIQIENNYLVAPKGVKYQWFLNGNPIIGARSQQLEVKEAGNYTVELVDNEGELLDVNTTVALSATGAVIRVFTIGDSTVQTYGSGYYPRTGWGQIIGNFFNTANVSFTNKAVGGTSSKSFYKNYWAAIRDGLQAGDFVFIQFGINDRNSADTARYSPTGVNGGTPVFENYLTKYINEIRAKGAFPVLVATLRRNAWNADGTVYDAYHDHPVATRNVAKSLSVPLIDLDAKAKVLLESVGKTYSTRFFYNNYVAGEYANYPNGNSDDVHFQEMGAIEMAKLVVQGIKDLSTDANVSKLIPYIKTQYQITVAATPSGNDSVTTRTTTYPVGLTITLKTIPKKNTAFQKWNNASNTQIATTTITTVNSTASATSYTAIYGGTACVASVTTTTPTTFCAGSNVVLKANTGNSYVWKNGTTQVATTANYTATTSGSYTVEVTNASGCKAVSAPTVVSVNALPTATITASGATTFCTAGSVTLTSSTGSSYVWKNGTTQVATTASYKATTSGSYTVEVTNAAGCKAVSAATVVTANATLTPSAITGDAIVCANATSRVYSVTSNSDAIAYNWTVPIGASITAGANTNSITVTFGAVSGEISVSQTNGCGVGAIVKKAVSITTDCILFDAVSTKNSIDLNWTIAGIQVKSIQLMRNTSSSTVGRGRIAIPAANSTTYSDTSAADNTDYWYWLKITDVNNVTYNSNSVQGKIAVVTGLDDAENEIIKVYPNPFSEEFAIKINNSCRYIIEDLHGKTIASGNTEGETLIGKNLEKGIYILKIISENQSRTLKVVKE